MEEKKFKDMTGNREEKIASKRPVADTSSADAPRAPKRPFVRVAPGAEQAEKISAKKAQPEQADKGQTSGGKPEHGAEQKHGEKNHGRNKHHHRGDRGKQASPKDAVKDTPKQETASAPQKAEPSAEQKNEQKPRRDRKPKQDRHRDRKPAAQETRPEKKETAAPEKTAEPVQNGKRDKRRDRHAKRDNFVLTDNVTVGREKKAPREEFTDEQLRADGLWFSLDEEAPVQKNVAAAETPAAEETPADAGETIEVVGIRFRGAGKTYYFSPAGISFEAGEHAIVETVRGVEYGDVAMGNRSVSISEVVQPLKPVVRKSTPEDDVHFAANRELENKAKPIFYEKVEKNKLEMQLVDVEYTFDNTKLCFYFTAEGRVDFRELVKDLASVFRTRIELRQIGVRDEARLFGGLGVCGRPFCCKSFLADFTQVSIKMAKEQNLSLASAKISGSCGRLMCCLRYEQDTYERENASLPRVGSTVDTPKGRANVLESNFLTGKIKVSDSADGTIRFHAIDEVQFVAPPARKSEKEGTGETDSSAPSVEE